MSINDNINFLENIKQGFKRTILWKKYKSRITIQPKNNNLDYLIDQTFRNINRLFVLSFKNGDDDATRNSFDKYYMSLVKIKDFNALIDNKPFFDQPVKNKQQVCEKLSKMSRNDDYTTGDLLDFSYHQNYYKLIGIDLPRQANTSIPQQINFVGKLEEDDGAKIYFIAEKQQKTILNFSKFVTRKWNIVNDNSNANYSVGNEVNYNTKVLKSNLCDYNDAYILLRGDITVTAAPETQVAFKHCASFTKCITTVDGTTIDDAENLDLVMPMYNLIECSSNYFETTGSFIQKIKQLVLMQILQILIILNLSSMRLNY